MIMIPPRVEPVEVEPETPWYVGPLVGGLGASIALPLVLWIRANWTDLQLILLLVGLYIVLPIALLWVVVRVIRSAWR